MVFNFLSGQFIDVIEWTDDTRDTMVYRFERQGHEIKYGAKLTVREGQTAVFIHEGQLADIFTPGLYILETNNMPILTTLQHWDHGFKSPFKSEIYFVNTNRFTNLKWGTKNPIMLRDPEFGPTRIRAFGTYTVKVADAGRFMTEIVGTDGEFTTDEITYQIRNIIAGAATVGLVGREGEVLSRTLGLCAVAGLTGGALTYAALTLATV
jgi:membrane protease subunit (stomatin/prohibitin family)